MSMSVLSFGPNTPTVTVQDVFVENRRKLIAQLLIGESKCQASHWVVFLEGGASQTRFDSDHEPIFRQESYFWWLTGVKEPDCKLMMMKKTDASDNIVDCFTTTLFVPRLPPEYAIIMGKIRSLDEWKEMYCVDEVCHNDKVEDVLLRALEQGGDVDSKDQPLIHSTIQHNHISISKQSPFIINGLLLLMKGPNSDSGKMYNPPALHNPNLQKYADMDILFPILAECRVRKSPAELRLMRQITEITSFAHAYVMRNVQADKMMEYQVESLFRHYCYYNYGCRLTGYTSICGCGPDAAILHYGHTGEPNNRPIKSGQMGLFDMGAEYMCYGSDVTCSYPVNGKFTDRQRIIYQAVYNAQVAVYRLMKPGISYCDCHKAAEAAILLSLVDAGLVIPCDKTIAELVELRLGAVFMPHGLGHFIGIDTHDVGGYLPGHPERSTLPGLKALRTSRILQANMVLTVEPGCYFINHLLNEALAEDSEVARYLNHIEIDTYRDFGGVRLEDVVQVTEDGIVNYTLCPRTIGEIESVMTGGKWPPLHDMAPELRRERLTDPTPLPSPLSL